MSIFSFLVLELSLCFYGLTVSSSALSSAPFVHEPALELEKHILSPTADLFFSVKSRTLFFFSSVLVSSAGAEHTK